MRGLKIAGWVALGVVVLFVLGAIAVVAFVDPNDYKDDIAKAVRDRTGRELKLDGKLSLSVFPWLAIETGHAELGNPPNFGAGPFVAVDSADVGVKLFPLLRGQFEVRRLLLDGLRVNLVKDEHGHTNWEDLSKSSTSTSSKDTSTTSATIAGLTIKNATLDYRDLGSGTHQRLTGLNLTTGRLGGSEPFDLDLTTSVDEGEGSAPMHLKLKSQATLDTQARHYGAKDLSLDVVQAPAKAGDKERKFQLQIPALDADLNQQTLDAPKFVLHAAGAELTGNLKGEQIVNKPRFAGSIRLPAVSPRDLLDEMGQASPKTRDAKALSTLALDANFKATGESVSFDNLKLTLDDTHVTGRAAIESLKDKALRFDLTVDQLDLDRYQEPEQKKPAQKEGGVSKPFELPVSELRTLNANGTVAIGSLTLSGMRMSAVKLTVDAKDGIVRLNPSQAKLYGGAHRGNVVIDARGDVAKLSIEEHMSGVQFAPLLTDLFNTKRLSGLGAATAVLAARGNDTDALLKTLDGRMDFELSNGALEGTDLWYEMRKARAAFKRESGPAPTNTGRTPFQALKGTGTVEKGVLSNRDLQIDMQYLRATGSGTLDLNTQAVDYRLQTTLYQVPQEGAGSEMKDLKAAEIPVRVSGTLNDPKIRPDVDALAKAEASKQLDAKKQDLTEKLKGKLDKWLGGKKP
ncbi:MAG TPA: AsmA family protein [Steroidobacteraceae bacterium]|nr:AsmA family protein [Steroidobacteraceae bacterium]